MISIKSIEWQNFLGYGDYPTKIDNLDSMGPVLVCGSLEESDGKSNGAGKSSIISAILWCLFGRTVKRSSPGDNVVNWYVGKDCVVEIKTTDGWTIRRTRKFKGHDDLLVYSGDKDESRGTNKDAQKFILKNFHLDYDIFVSSVFFMQSAGSFLEMGDAKRKEALERLLGIDKLNVWSEVAKEKGDKVEANVADIRKDIERLERDIERYRSSGEENRKNAESFERNRADKIALLQTEIDSCKQKIEQMDQKKIESLVGAWEEWASLEESVVEMDRKLRYEDGERVRLSHAIEMASESKKTAMEVLSQIPSDEEIERLAVQYRSFESERLSIRAKRDGRIKKERVLSEKVSERLIAEKDAEKYRVQAITLANSIKDIVDPSGGKCQTCGQSVSSDETERQCHQNKMRRDKIKAESLKFAEKVSEMKSVMDSLDAEIDDIKASISADEWTEERVAQEIAAITPKFTLADLEAKRRSRTDRSSAIAKYEREIEHGQKNLAEIQKVIADLEKVMEFKRSEMVKKKPPVPRDEILAMIRDLEAQRGKMRDREKQKSEESARPNPYADVANGEFLRADKAQGEMDNKKTKVQSSIETLTHYQYIQKAYGDRRKIKSMIIGELIPYFNQRIQYYLSAFEIDLDLEFTQSLGFQTEKWPFDFCSGGEQKRISVAIMFAMHDLWLAIYGRQCNVMALDEVDTALDESGASAFVNIINNDFAEKKKERPTPDTIFIISHRNDMVDAFPKKMMIRRDSTRFSHLVDVA